MPNRKKVKIRKREGACPYCGRYVNAAATLQDHQAAPRPGDLSLCVKCRNVCKFGPNLQLQRLSTVELADALLDPEVVAMIARAKAGIIVLGETEYVD